MHYLLHIDTSTDTGSVAIGCDGRLLAHRTNTETRNHASTINILISETLADVHITLEQLSGIVVCAGPGSYTGLRIGMATAKGLCYALDKPLLPDNKLTLLAYNAYKHNNGEASQFISLLVAREKEYFITIYNNNFTCLLPPQHIMEERLNNLIDNNENTVIITNTPHINNLLRITNLQIDHTIQINFDLWIFYAYEQFLRNNFVNLSSAEPFYLKQVYTHK